MYRVGSNYGIHVYEGQRPVATFHDAAEAATFVRVMNTMLEDADQLILDLQGGVEMPDLAGNVESVPGGQYIYEEQHPPAPTPLFALLERAQEGDVIEMGGYRYTAGERMSAGTTVMMGDNGKIVRYRRGDE